MLPGSVPLSVPSVSTHDLPRCIRPIQRYFRSLSFNKKMMSYFLWIIVLVSVLVVGRLVAGRRGTTTTITTTGQSSSSSSSSSQAYSPHELTHTSTVYPDDDTLPPITKQFRKAKVDWHRLVKVRREFKDTGRGDVDLEFQIQAEKRALKQLIGSSGHEQHQWGSNHGPQYLADYETCRVFSEDVCLKHTSNKQECIQNSFCGWCPSSGLCMDRYWDSHHDPVENPHQRSSCPTPLEIKATPKYQDCHGQWYAVENGQQHTIHDLSQCNHIHGEPTIFGHISNDAGAMYWHWITEFYDDFVKRAQGLIPGDEPGGLHIMITGGDYSLFYPFFGLISRFCPRYTKHIRTEEHHCFCSPTNTGTHIQDMNQFMITRLGLQTVIPSKEKPRLGILSRQMKRFLVNEVSMCRIAVSKGLECILLPLEQMTIYEQIREFKKLHFLTAIHGSGVSNALFVSSSASVSGWSSYILHISPFHVFDSSGIFTRFATPGTIFRDWTNPFIENTVFHWHFLSDYPNRANVIRSGTHGCGGQCIFLTNSDTYMDEQEWELLLEDMLAGRVSDPSPRYKEAAARSEKSVEQYI